MKHFSSIKKINKSYLLVFLIVFIIFALKSYLITDPDFGWHLKMGELVFQKGIPKTDPYSYTMPSYPLVDHEWLTDVLTWFVYKYLGLIGLSVLFAAIGTLTIWILSKSIPKPFISQFILLFGFIFLPFIGVRPQVFSWLYLTFLLVLFNQYETHWQYKYFVPIFFLIWSNMHGSFLLGTLFLLLFYLNKLFLYKKINITNVSIFAFSITATLLPPYGWRKWWEVWMSLSDTQLRWRVSEWQPAFFSVDFAFLLFLAFSLSLLMKYGFRVVSYVRIIYGALLLMALGSVRHIPLWACVASFQIGHSLDNLLKELSQQKKFVLETAIKFLWIIVGVACTLQTAYILLSVPKIVLQNSYPSAAIAFLKEQKIKGNVFSTYNWGGYLIWHYPEKKVFIDGRMPSWRWNAPKGESDSAYVEWGSVLTGKIKIQDIQKKYNIEVVLVPTKQQTNMRQKPSKIYGFFQNLFSKGTEKDVFSVFKILYQDKIATIYSLTD